MRVMQCLVLSLLLASLGCGTKKGADAESTLAENKAPTPVEGNSEGNSVTMGNVENAVTEIKPPVAPPVPLPPYSGAAVSKEVAKKSRALNIEALTLHRAKKFAESAPLFVQSLEANPGNILARYNLACTYNLDGKRKEALETLEQLKVDTCRACLAQVKGAPADKDFVSALEDQKFIELTSGIPVKSTTRRKLAKLVQRAYEKKDVSLISHLVHPSRGTLISEEMLICEGRGCIGGPRRYGLEEFSAGFKRTVNMGEEEDAMLWFSVPDEVGKCGKKCCEYPVEEVGHGSYWLSKVCFSERAGMFFISEVGFGNGS